MGLRSRECEHLANRRAPMTTERVSVTEHGIQLGTLVEHPARPEWGPGKVLRVKGERVEVFFRDLAGEEAKKFDSSHLRVASVQEDPILDNLPPFLERRGKLRLGRRRVTVAEARAAFLRHFPGGFSDDRYLAPEEGERTYKWLAHERYASSLGQGSGRALLQEGRIDDLVNRLWKTLGLASNLLAVTEVIAFKQGLSDLDGAARYFATLFDLVDGGPVEGPFTAHCTAVASLPSEGATHTDKWTIATLLPYLARPDTFMYVKPAITKKAAAALAFEIGYDSSPNWATYDRILRMSHAYRERLADLAPRDFIDLQSFFWVTGDTYEQVLAADEARKKT